MRCCFPYLPLLAGISLSMLTGCETTTRVATRAYHYLPFTGQEDGKELSAKKSNLSFKMELEPKEIKLSDVRQVSVKISLQNNSRRFVQLQFPTTQRIEILVRDDKRRLVTQWSEDRAYEQVPGYVGINRGERVEYNTTVSTRDLQAGKTYTIVAFMPNFEELRSEATIIPQP